MDGAATQLVLMDFNNQQIVSWNELLHALGGLNLHNRRSSKSFVQTNKCC